VISMGSSRTVIDLLKVLLDPSADKIFGPILAPTGVGSGSPGSGLGPLPR
jgi:hypothetical protein